MTTRRTLLTAALPLAASAAGSRATRAQNLHGDEALSKVLVDGEGWQLVAEGLGLCDAGCADAAGAFYFSDLARGVLHRVGPDGRGTALWTGAPRLSGMKIGPDGRLFAVSQGPQRQVLAVTLETKMGEVLADGFEANDLVVTRRGFVYFTDASKGQVVALDPKGGTRPVAQGLAKPSGLALSPDEGTLAVAEGGGDRVWAFRVERSGDLAHGSPWMQLRTPVGRADAGADGMATDADGRTYVTSTVGIQMFDWTGRLGGVIAKPSSKAVVSCTFAGPDRAHLYVCAGDRVYRRKMKVKGPAALASR